MLTFTYLMKPTLSQNSEIIGLYRVEGWWSNETDGAELVDRIVSGSHCFLIVKKESEIIGMGRALSDGVSDAYIQDVTVKKNFRGQGIGTKIIQKLVERLHSDGLKWVGLIAEKNSHPFYEQLGFKKMSDSVPMLKIK